jgi:hypothetical protein
MRYLTETALEKGGRDAPSYAASYAAYRRKPQQYTLQARTLHA